jgi:hypothetical protein
MLTVFCYHLFTEGCPSWNENVENVNKISDLNMTMWNKVYCMDKVYIIRGVQSIRAIYYFLYCTKGTQEQIHSHFFEIIPWLLHTFITLVHEVVLKFFCESWRVLHPLTTEIEWQHVAQQWWNPKAEWIFLHYDCISYPITWHHTW